MFHVVGSVHQARSAEARGADGVIATGTEAAGPGSTDNLSLLTLVPQVVDAIEIPVIASGGISDGRGLAAAIGLGASAAYIGTRFVATHECVAHPNFKDAIINAVDTSTAIATVGTRPVRLLRNTAFDHLGNSTNGARGTNSHSDEQTRTSLLDGAIDDGLIYCGASAGVVNEVMSAADVVKVPWFRKPTSPCPASAKAPSTPYTSALSSTPARSSCNLITPLESSSPHPRPIASRKSFRARSIVGMGTPYSCPSSEARVTSLVASLIANSGEKSPVNTFFGMLTCNATPSPPPRPAPPSTPFQVSPQPSPPR